MSELMLPATEVVTADLHSYLDEVRRLPGEEFLSISKQISPKYETSALVHRLEQQQRFPVIQFENTGTEMPMVTNLFASHRRLAIALGAQSSSDAVQRYLELEGVRRPPVRVPRSEAPVKEIVWKGDEVDLRRLPIITHHTEDSGAYITAGVMVCQDPESGAVNCGIFRHELRGPRELGAMLQPFSHSEEIYRRYKARGQHMPVAIFIGHHPAVIMASASRTAFGESELDVAGGLLGGSLAVIQGETVDIDVPARAEIVVEGYLDCTDDLEDGPFGEYTGYYGDRHQAHRMHVTCVTMRRGAIYHDVFAGHADHRISVIAGEANIYRVVKQAVPTLIGVHRPVSGSIYHCYISIRKRAEGQGKVAGLAALIADPNLKHAFVVDEDIDPYNEREVLWAVATRFQADTDLTICTNTTGATLDPTAYGEIRSQDGSMTTKMVFDATKPLHRPFPQRVQVPKEVVDRIRLEDFIPEGK